MICKYTARDRRWGSTKGGGGGRIVLFNILCYGLNRLAAGLNSASQTTVLAVVGMKKGKMNDLKALFLMLKSVHLFGLYKSM